MLFYLKQLEEWIIALGEKHAVDPLLLGILYLISKVSFLFCLGWAFKRLRAKKALVFPLLFALLSFSIPYLYLVIAGRNIPAWVYALIGFMFIYGTYSIFKKVAAKKMALDGTGGLTNASSDYYK